MKDVDDASSFQKKDLGGSHPLGWVTLSQPSCALWDFGSISGFYPLITSSISLPSCSNQNCLWGVPFVALLVKNPTSIHEVVGSISGPAQWVKDLALLWLWCKAGSCNSNSTPRPGDSMCHRYGPEKQSKTKQKVSGCCQVSPGGQNRLPTPQH